METILIRTLQLILSLSILIVVHEMGHFLFARLFKVRVEKFSLFFDPWFTLFKYKPKNSETEYAIGWLPLGGYVKIAGMIDESMDTEQMKKPIQEWEFRAKPAWQRLLIMIGGVLFNFILAIFIYAMILFTWGDNYIKIQEANLGMAFNSAAHGVGFRDGDILVSADGFAFERYDGETLSRIVEANKVTVKRNGELAEISIPNDMMQRILKDSVTTFARYRMPFVADSIKPNSPAALYGFQKGDSIVELNDKSVSFQEFVEELSKIKKRNSSASLDDSSDKFISVKYIRGGVESIAQIELDTLYQLGIFPILEQSKLFSVENKQYGFFESIPLGIDLGVNTMKNYVSSLKHIFSKEGAKQVGGFASIASVFPERWDWLKFWNMTALISIMLAFLNILPIPALDGGHVLFLLYETVTRRKPSDKFLEYAQIVGMIFLFGLLIWANLNDVIKFLF